MDCPFYHKEEETFDHLLRNCELAFNIWSTVNANCDIMDWIEHIWTQNSWYEKTCFNPLEKIFTFIGIWNHCNNIYFKSHKRNSIAVIEQARHIKRYRVLYH